MSAISQRLSTPAPIELDSEEAIHYLKLYAANSPYRSAGGDELIIQDNPYRRPVRREDLDFLSFGTPLKKSNILSLSALAAQRMLLNIYETDMVLLPHPENAAAEEEFKLFYSNSNKVLGEIVRPFLEKHVFSFLEAETKIEDQRSAASGKDYLLSFEQQDAPAENKLAHAILSSAEPQKTANLFLIQLIGAAFSREFAIARGILGTDGNILSKLTRTLIAEDGKSLAAAQQRNSLQSLARSCGLMETPHAYWQFYLSSSMALTNYFHYVARDHSMFFRYLGALYHHRVNFNAHCREYRELLQNVHGPNIDTSYFAEAGRGTLFQDLIEPTLVVYGERALPEIARGFAAHRILTEIAEDDFIAQIRWSSRTEEYKEKARLISQRIKTEKLNLDLETYVESCEECSTTHVHDTDRLLVIESGEMNFWSCFGPAIRFTPGDQILIPKSRLHGSLVLSNECTYHQPIIPPELLREFE